MNCEEVQSLITPYIQNELKSDMGEVFAEHILNCKTCKNELEITYCLMTAIRQLNEDETFSGNYIAELNHKLMETIKEAKREKRMITKKRIYVIVELFVLGLIIGLGFL